MDDWTRAAQPPASRQQTTVPPSNQQGALQRCEGRRSSPRPRRRPDATCTGRVAARASRVPPNPHLVRSPPAAGQPRSLPVVPPLPWTARPRSSTSLAGPPPLSRATLPLRQRRRSPRLAARPPSQPMPAAFPPMLDRVLPASLLGLVHRSGLASSPGPRFTAVDAVVLLTVTGVALLLGAKLLLAGQQAAPKVSPVRLRPHLLPATRQPFLRRDVTRMLVRGGNRECSPPACGCPSSRGHLSPSRAGGGRSS